jgi:GIY-YIG catalytic domain
MIDPQTIEIKSLPSISLSQRSQLPATQGIYFVLDASETVQYIGRSINIQQRWLRHHRYQQLTEIGFVKIAWLTVSNKNLLAQIEMALIDWFKPPLNKSRCQKRTGLTGRPRNPNPVRTEDFKKHNYQSYGGDELNLPLGSKPFSTRMPIDVEEILLAMHPKERVILIRSAVVKAVRDRDQERMSKLRFATCDLRIDSCPDVLSQ